MGKNFGSNGWTMGWKALAVILAGLVSASAALGAYIDYRVDHHPSVKRIAERQERILLLLERIATTLHISTSGE